MTGLLLPNGAIQQLIEHVKTYGRNEVETGALLMCSPNSDTVRAVALAGARGVTRRYGLFVLSMRVIDSAFSYAEDRGLQVRAQVHSHAGAAFLSPTDKKGNLTMNGFIAAVIPNFRNPPRDPESWGWWTFGAGAWRTSAPARPDQTLSSASILTVDEDGAHEH
ncbi:MAG: hypothetical protein JWR34_735 [Mycobacterium sp.]|nr:hypothetical protein [Mycobacterium sp.]